MKRNVKKTEFFLGRAVSLILGVVIIAVVVLAPSCEKEDMGDVIGISTIHTKDLEVDTFYTTADDFPFDTIKLDWKVKKYNDFRWRGIFKWQGPEFIPYEEAIRIFLKMGWASVDFPKLDTNDGRAIRGNIQVKFPECVDSKEEAEYHTEQLYKLLSNEIKPIPWIVINQGCKY